MICTDPTELDWRLTEHVCLACFGRVLSHKPAIGDTLFICSNCGVTGQGYDGLPGGGAHPSICACGARVGGDKPGRKRKKGERINPGRNAGIRCVPNNNLAPECPAEFIARDGG